MDTTQDIQIKNVKISIVEPNNLVLYIIFTRLQPIVWVSNIAGFAGLIISAVLLGNFFRVQEQPNRKNDNQQNMPIMKVQAWNRMPNTISHIYLGRVNNYYHDVAYSSWEN